jgi:hypothetical protein
VQISLVLSAYLGKIAYKIRYDVRYHSSVEWKIPPFMLYFLLKFKANTTQCSVTMHEQRWRRKAALPFLFLFLQVFSVFSDKSFLPFCMGNFKKGAKYFSLSLSPGFLRFLRERFSLFSSTLATRCLIRCTGVTRFYAEVTPMLFLSFHWDDPSETVHIRMILRESGIE